MTNEQAAALLYGIARTVNRIKFDCNEYLENADLDRESAGRAVWSDIERLEQEIERQIKMLYGIPP